MDGIMFSHPEINPTVITLIWTDAFADGKLRFCIRWELASAIFLPQSYGPGGLPPTSREVFYNVVSASLAA
jgi:hypothetical protein